MSNFILTLPLQAEKFQEDILNKRLEIARKMYNTCLNELFKRYDNFNLISYKDYIKQYLNFIFKEFIYD